MIEKILLWFVGKEQAKRYEFILKHELGLSVKNAEQIAFGFAGLFSLVFLLACFLFEFNSELIIAGFLLALSFGYFLAIFILIFLAERKQLEKDQCVAATLMQASLLPNGTSVERMIKEMGILKNPLAKEFKIAVKEIMKGVPTSDALDGIKRRCPKRNIKKIVQILKIADSTGNISSKVLREAAKEIIDEQALLKERASLLTIQKTSVLISSMVLVPFILGTLSGITKDIDLSYLDIVEMEKTAYSELIECSKIASILYIAELSIIAGLFLGVLENNLKKGVIYLVAILPVALAIFLALS